MEWGFGDKEVNLGINLVRSFNSAENIYIYIKESNVLNKILEAGQVCTNSSAKCSHKVVKSTNHLPVAQKKFDPRIFLSDLNQKV